MQLQLSIMKKFQIFRPVMDLIPKETKKALHFTSGFYMFEHRCFYTRKKKKVSTFKNIESRVHVRWFTKISLGFAKH